MSQSGKGMPPAGVPTGSPSKAINHAIETSRDSWNRHGNQTADQALKNDKATIRKPLSPDSLGPKK